MGPRRTRSHPPLGVPNDMINRGALRFPPSDVPVEGNAAEWGRIAIFLQDFEPAADCRLHLLRCFFGRCSIGRQIGNLSEARLEILRFGALLTRTGVGGGSFPVMGFFYSSSISPIDLARFNTSCTCSIFSFLPFHYCRFSGRGYLSFIPLACGWENIVDLFDLMKRPS